MYTSVSTSRLSAKSDLFPARAMTMLGLACLCSSFTQDLARTNVSCHSQWWYRQFITLNLNKTVSKCSWKWKNTNSK